MADLLDLRCGDPPARDRFGSGNAIGILAERASPGTVSGIDPPREMVAQAAARNVAAVRAGRVDVQQGSADRLRFASRTFDQAAAINSLEVRPDAAAGLREAHCAQARGRVALGFAPFAAQSNAAVAAAIAGFASRAQPTPRTCSRFIARKSSSDAPARQLPKGGWV